MPTVDQLVTGLTNLACAPAATTYSQRRARLDRGRAREYGSWSRCKQPQQLSCARLLGPWAGTILSILSILSITDLPGALKWHCLALASYSTSHRVLRSAPVLWTKATLGLQRRCDLAEAIMGLNHGTWRGSEKHAAFCAKPSA
jgi:hypothetical protein